MNNIKITVIVPVLNEVKTINSLLQSLNNQIYQPDEIIICDGGSTDGTIDLINKIKKKISNISITEQKSKCRGSGRNIAISNSINQYIAMIDAGTVADIHWLYNLVEKLKNNKGTDVVFGVIKPIIENSFDAAIANVILGKYYKENILSPSVSSILINKNVFKEIGLFPTNQKGKYVVEDLVFLNNLNNNKKLIKINCRKALVNWHLSKNYKSLILRFISNSRGGIAYGFFKKWHLKTIQNISIYLILISLGFFNIIFLFFLFLYHFLRVYSYYKHHSIEYKKGLIMKFKSFIKVSNVILSIDLATVIGIISWLIIDKLKLINNEN